MTDEQLIEAMVARIRANTSWLLAEEAAQIATAALAKVDEVYRRIPKDQEPVGWLYRREGCPSYLKSPAGRSPGYVDEGWTETPLYAIPEKRHD